VALVRPGGEVPGQVCRRLPGVQLALVHQQDGQRPAAANRGRQLTQPDAALSDQDAYPAAGQRQRVRQIEVVLLLHCKARAAGLCSAAADPMKEQTVLCHFTWCRTETESVRAAAWGADEACVGMLCTDCCCCCGGGGGMVCLLPRPSCLWGWLHLTGSNVAATHTLLLLLAAAGGGCCCWLLLLAAAVGCCCWLLLLAAAGGCNPAFSVGVVLTQLRRVGKQLLHALLVLLQLLHVEGFVAKSPLMPSVTVQKVTEAPKCARRCARSTVHTL